MVGYVATENKILKENIVCWNLKTTRTNGTGRKQNTQKLLFKTTANTGLRARRGSLLHRYGGRRYSSVFRPAINAADSSYLKFIYRAG